MMLGNEIKKIIKNIFILSSSQSLSILLMFFLVMFISNYYGKSQLGTFTLVTSYANIFLIFSNIGINTLIFKDISKNHSEAGKYIGNIIPLKLLLFLLSLLLLSAILAFMNYGALVNIYIYIISIFVLFQSISYIFIPILSSFEHMKYQGLSQLIVYSTVTFVGIPLLIYNYSWLYLFALYPLGGAFSTFYLSYVASKKFNIKYKIHMDLQFWKYCIINGLPFSILSVFQPIFFQIIVILLSRLSSVDNVGAFSAAFYIIYAILFMPLYISVALFPLTSRKYVQSKHIAENSVKKTITLLVISGCIVCISLFFISDKIIYLVHGPNFGDSVLILQLFLFILPFRFVNTFLCFAVYPIFNKQWKMFVSITLSILVCVVSGIVLIDQFKLYGGAIAIVMSEIFLSMILINISRNTFTFSVLKLIFKPILILVTILLFIYSNLYDISFKNIYLELLMLSILPLFGYICIAILLKCIPIENVKHLKIPT